MIAHLPTFLRASLIVLEVTVAAVLLSWVCGLIAALGKGSRVRIFRDLSNFYVWFIRGTPALVQVFTVYYGLPQLGIKFAPFMAGVVALGLNSGAYVAEIVRGGFLAIPRAQSETAFALGMSHGLVLRRIVMPQVLRVILPSLTNEAASMLKNTSLLSTITVLELTLVSQIIIAQTFRPFEFYILASALYLVMTTGVTWLAGKLEKRWAWTI